MAYGLGRGIWVGWEDPVELDGSREVWFLLLRVFWLLLPGFDFCGGTGRWAMSPRKFRILLIFPNFLGLGFFGNS